MTANTEEKDIKVAEADKEVSQKGEEAGATNMDALKSQKLHSLNT